MDCAHTHGHLEGGIVEDRLCMVEGHQVVGLEVAGSCGVGLCVIGDGGGVDNKQRLWGYLTHVEICEGVGIEIDARTGGMWECGCVWDGMGCRVMRELREENTQDGREVRWLLLRLLMMGMMKEDVDVVVIGTGN